MSRTEQDWEQARLRAVEVKRRLQDLSDVVEDFETWDERDERMMQALMEKLDEAEALVNELIGSSTVTWAPSNGGDPV